jgi:hypothetical protein
MRTRVSDKKTIEIKEARQASLCTLWKAVKSYLDGWRVLLRTTAHISYWFADLCSLTRLYRTHQIILVFTRCFYRKDIRLQVPEAEKKNRTTEISMEVNRRAVRAVVIRAYQRAIREVAEVHHRSRDASMSGGADRRDIWMYAWRKAYRSGAVAGGPSNFSSLALAMSLNGARDPNKVPNSSCDTRVLNECSVVSLVAQG